MKLACVLAKENIQSDHYYVCATLSVVYLSQQKSPQKSEIGNIRNQSDYMWWWKVTHMEQNFVFLYFFLIVLTLIVTYLVMNI